MGWDSWVAAAGDLILGGQCPGCDRPGWGICTGCRRAVSRPSGYLTRPDPCPEGFPLTATSTPYDAVMKRLVSAHKERQVLTLTPFLAERLATAIECLLQESGRLGPSTAVFLVPVPSSPAAVRHRGFDATWAMARRAARACTPGRTVSAKRLLALSRRLQDQAGLGAADRKRNLEGGLRVTGGRPAPGTVVVLVDDVVTTGSSLTEAARALRAARITVLGAATVAATVRSRSRSPWL